MIEEQLKNVQSRPGFSKYGPIYVAINLNPDHPEVIVSSALAYKQ